MNQNPVQEMTNGDGASLKTPDASTSVFTPMAPVTGAGDLHPSPTPQSTAESSANVAMTQGADMVGPTKAGMLKAALLNVSPLNLDLSRKQMMGGEEAGFLRRYLLGSGLGPGESKGVLPVFGEGLTAIPGMLSPLATHLALPAVGATVDKLRGLPGGWRQNFARYVPAAQPELEGRFNQGWLNRFGMPYESEGNLKSLAYDTAKPLGAAAVAIRDQFRKMFSK